MSSSPPLSSVGVGSGLDVQGIVTKLVQAEGSPTATRLNTAEAQVQAKLSALGTLRSALASFQDTVAVLKDVEKFRGRSATLSSSDFLDVSAAATAAPGTYSIEVEQLAQAHKLQSQTFASTSTVVGTGTLSILTGGETFDVAIDSTTDTLTGIAAAINDSAAGAKVVATVVVGTGGAARLTLTARASGAANALTVTASGGDGGLAVLATPPAVGGLTEITPAQDAKVLIDGFEASSSTNTVTDAISGVELDLLAANQSGGTSQLTVGYDVAAARASIDDFVKSYNAVVDAIDSVASYNTDTKQGGPLFGDIGVRNLGYQLRRVLSDAVPGIDQSFDMLTKIGVTTQVDGKLSVDSAKADAAFSSNFDAIGDLFADPTNGLAVKLNTLLDPYLQSNGVFDSRTASLQSSIDDIGKQRDALNARLQVLQDRYLKQFNALDTLLSQLQSTSNYLTQQLSQLPGYK